jgi:hypothetical protein
MPYFDFFDSLSHYHKSGYFQDNTANREFFRANLRLDIQIVGDFTGMVLCCIK